MKRFGMGIAGVLIGFAVGAVLGVLGMKILGRLLFGPDFFQISWVFVPFVFFGVGLASACFGGKLATEKPRLFARTFLPVFGVLLTWGIADYFLRRIERPRR